MNVTCEDIRNLALLAACGEAEAADAATVKEHAARCPACAAEIAALHEGLDLLRHVPQEAPSRETRESIGAMLFREAPRPASSRAKWIAVAAAVLMAATAFVVSKALYVPAGPGTKSPVATYDPGPVEPGPKGGTPKPAPVSPKKKTSAEALAAWTHPADDDLDSISEAFQGLGSTRTASARPAPSAVWYRSDSSTVDSMYESLDSITTTPDKF